MDDLELVKVAYEKDGSIWKTATIQRLQNGGLCAISKNEPIGKNDLYYYNKELFYNNLETPPKGSSKVISIYYWFNEISTKVGEKLKFKVKTNYDKYQLIWPLEIKLKKHK